MPRLKLKPLANYPYRMPQTVRTTDLNYGGHLGNDSLLSLVHEARVGWLDQFGWSELDCAGSSLIMGDAALMYQGQAFAGDELVFEVGAGEATRSGFRLFCRVTRPEREGAVAIALVECGLVCYDYERGQIGSLPEPVQAVCRDA